MSFIINAFRFGGGGGGAENLVVITKTTSETRTLSDTHAPDSELVSETLESNSVYKFKIRVAWVSGATPDFKCRIGRTGLSDASVYYNSESSLDSSVAAQDFSSLPFSIGNGSDKFASLTGVLITGADTGVLSYDWAQNTSSAEGTTVLAGSAFIIEKAG